MFHNVECDDEKGVQKTVHEKYGMRKKIQKNLFISLKLEFLRPLDYL